MSERYPHLKEQDPEIYALIQKQAAYEASTLKMIASENYASYSVLEATGSSLTNKYAEGYPAARYYEGNEVIDEVENLCINRLKQVFGAEHANVQPLSGSPANSAVYRAVMAGAEKVMGMPVNLGGHLTHGWKVNFSGMDYTQVPFGPSPETGLLDYDQIREIAKAERPRMIWCGATAYPRRIDYEKFAEIAAEVDAYLVADIAHISGLIAGGALPSPVPYCDIVTSTTHKMMRGPRSGFILCKEADRYQEKYYPTSKFNLAKRIDRAVFPGLQGGPHENVIAAMAVAFGEALKPEFKDYAAQVIKNARHLGECLVREGVNLATGGTDTHMLLLDFRNEEFTGKDMSDALAKAGIIANFNMVPGDQRKPTVTSGVRMGTGALTTMGMKEKDMEQVASWIIRIVRAMPDASAVSAQIRGEVAEYCKQFKVPGLYEE
ncbi:MAG: serine hydroxymethyltransferase [Thermoguttaceae bacterium]|nr:serine hydroxymethyltransferase [Thermoguttaceae bacterium]